jgi:hypothetical protein
LVASIVVCWRWCTNTAANAANRFTTNFTAANHSAANLTTLRLQGQTFQLRKASSPWKLRQTFRQKILQAFMWILWLSRYKYHASTITRYRHHASTNLSTLRLQGQVGFLLCKTTSRRRLQENFHCWQLLPPFVWKLWVSSTDHTEANLSTNLSTLRLQRQVGFHVRKTKSRWRLQESFLCRQLLPPFVWKLWVSSTITRWKHNSSTITSS